jgi:hypothetical protein
MSKTRYTENKAAPHRLIKKLKAGDIRMICKRVAKMNAMERVPNNA